MPSNKNPASVVNPGPGRLAAGTLTESAFVFNGGSGTAAHLVDPVDAHMASAIGIHPEDLRTGRAILHSAGGVVDGESVEDFIMAAMDLWPTPPNRIGWADPGVPNSGRPNWGYMGDGDWTDTVVAGAFLRDGEIVFTRTVYEHFGDIIVGGAVYPADRGVLAFYWTPAGDFADPGTTLKSALWLGGSPAPAGIPSADFDEARRPFSQLAYWADATGINHTDLTNRCSCRKNLLPLGWDPYAYNFAHYQIARYQAYIYPLAGDSGSWLWVHWREAYVTSLASITPPLLLSQLVAGNCYSAVPYLGDFEEVPVRHVVRHNTYLDDGSGTDPSGTIVSTISPSYPGIFTFLSGVGHLTGANLKLDFTVTANGLWDGPFYTSNVGGFPNNPIAASYCPLTLDVSDFNTGIGFNVPYYSMRKVGSGVVYGVTNPPLPEDSSEYVSTLTIAPLAGYTPPKGEAVLRAELRRPFKESVISDTVKYMFNSHYQGISANLDAVTTSTKESFVNEAYRFESTYVPNSATQGIDPAGPSKFKSHVVFVADGPDLQVVGGELQYPQTDYTVGYSHTSANYAAVLANDAAHHVRRYIRAFDTGFPRRTGRIRVRNLLRDDVYAPQPYSGDEVTDHPGGVVLQVRVPGSTDWLDLGRDKKWGDDGCQLSFEYSDGDLCIAYDTGEYTEHASGAYPIFVRVSFIKGPGHTKTIRELEWLPPKN